jgi:hypothetical protein
MRINIIKLSLEFKYPTIYEYSLIKSIVNLVNSHNSLVKMNMENITQVKQIKVLKTNEKLENTHIYTVQYDDSKNIINYIDNILK